MTAIVVETTVACQSDIVRVWGAITDTERLNRVMGMNRVNAKPLRDASAARYLMSTQLGGLPVEYEERPFEWIYPKRFKFLRRMRSGPLLTLEVAYALESRPDGGTDVKLRLSMDPRYRLISPFVRFMGGLSARDLEDAITRMDASIQEGNGVAPPARRTTVATGAFTRAEAALRQAEPERRALVDKLLAHVADADDLEISRIRPFALADDWHADRHAFISVCLAAVRAGLLELRWEIVCPSCRTATDVLPSLASLSDHGVCQLCDLKFAVDLEDAVEATFAPVRAVREVDIGPYCIGGPARTPHVLAQAILPAGGEARLVCPPEEGRYRLFVRGGATAPVEVKDGAPREVRVAAQQLERERARETGKPHLVAPEGSLVVENPSGDERHVKLERLVWADQAARARIITTLPAFRRDFSQDILRPGVALKVARVCLFFSDLTGSTKLYSDAGDAAAFKVVHDHFDVVIGLIEKNNGTLVKTIGDAVMAAFADDLDGLLGSVAILHAFEEFRGAGGHRRSTHLKIGVFGGPCYVVTANGILDYFGQTVNIAARLQGEARSGELVVEQELADRAVALKALPEAFVVERYDAKLKGVPAPVRAARIRVAPG